MMGREASVHAEVGGEAGEVRAILESSELILRGAIRRRFPKPMLERVTVQSDMLRFTCAGERVRLHLGARTAAIATPPPSLRAKLGLDKGARALLVGSFDDDELAGALEGVLVKDGAAAAMLIACVKRPEDLSAARAIHAAHEGLPLWKFIRKGAASPSAKAILAPCYGLKGSATPSRAPCRA
jgi:hypothetical protein